MLIFEQVIPKIRSRLPWSSAAWTRAELRGGCRSSRRLLRILIGLAALPGGCAPDPIAECQRLVDSGRDERAAEVCAEAFTSTGALAAAAAAAQAHLRAGHGEEALEWAARLMGTAREADGRAVVASELLHRGDAPAAERESLAELELRRRAGDHAGAARAAYRLYYLAWTGSGGDDYFKALDYAVQSLEEATAAEEPEPMARAYQALATVFYEVGDLRRAARILEAAEPLVDPEDRLELARLLVYRGLIELNGGYPALARDHFERALELAAGEDERAFFRSTYLNQVKARLALDDLEGAVRAFRHAEHHLDRAPERPPSLAYYDARLALAHGQPERADALLAEALARNPAPSWRRDLEFLRGEAAAASGRSSDAVDAYRRSTEVVEEMRGSLQLDELKVWMLERRRRAFEALFALHAREGRAVEALEVSEQARGRTFLEALLRTTEAGEADPRPQATVRTARSRLEALAILLPAMEASPVVTVRRLEELADPLAGRHVLDYFRAGDELWLGVLAGGAGDRPRLVQIAEPWPRIAERVSRFLADPADEEVAEELGRLLLPAPALEGAPDRVILVLDGALGRLPFAALRRNGRHLVEDLVLTHVPSLNALASIENAPAAPAGPPVVLADPRGDLAAARREAEEVAARLRVVPRVGAVMTSGTLLRARDARVLHVASHTGLGPRGPWVATADGEVVAGELMAGGVAPGLVVLATCSSAARRGSGLWGSLAGSFLAAGSDTVVGALWSVSDDAAREFVLRFYDEGGAEDPAGALALTQRRWIDLDADASIWAAFVAFGSDRLHRPEAAARRSEGN